MDTDTVPTYAQIAIDRWSLSGLPAGNIRTAAGRHDPRICACLVCADGREALGMQPLKPSWARRAVPDFYRRRSRR